MCIRAKIVVYQTAVHNCYVYICLGDMYSKKIEFSSNCDVFNSLTILFTILLIVFVFVVSLCIICLHPLFC